MKNALLLFAAVVFLAGGSAYAADAAARKPIPVILDTDIGDDIDDTWALGFLLRCPELDVKLVVGDHGRAQHRAKLIAKFLEAAGRTDIPVGIGLDVKPDGTGNQAEWVKDYDLSKYPGKVHADGVQSLIDTIMNSPEPVTLLAIGPLDNLPVALQREPRIAQRARFVGMHGSVRVGYNGSKTPAAEWNVKAAPKACQTVFTAPWDMTITPLDTCGLINLSGDLYARVRDAKDPIAAAIIANYRLWSTHGKPDNKAADSHSSTLFDTVAVYLAFSQELCAMERLGLRVTDDGFTRIDDTAKQVNCAMAWKDLDAFRRLLVERLTTAGK